MEGIGMDQKEFEERKKLKWAEEEKKERKKKKKNKEGKREDNRTITVGSVLQRRAEVT